MVFFNFRLPNCFWLGCRSVNTRSLFNTSDCVIRFFFLNYFHFSQIVLDLFFLFCLLACNNKRWEAPLRLCVISIVLSVFDFKLCMCLNFEILSTKQVCVLVCILPVREVCILTV